MSAKRECERAHVSDALPICEAKLASAKLENNHELSQANSCVLKIVLASTRSRTREYAQSFAWVTIFVGVSCNRINKLWCTCGTAIWGKLVPGDTLSWLYYNKYIFASVILYKWNIWNKPGNKNLSPSHNVDAPPPTQHCFLVTGPHHVICTELLHSTKLLSNERVYCNLRNFRCRKIFVVIEDYKY